MTQRCSRFVHRVLFCWPIFRPRRTYSASGLLVCLSVGLAVTSGDQENAADLIEMQFGLVGRVSPRNQADGGWVGVTYCVERVRHWPCTNTAEPMELVVVSEVGSRNGVLDGGARWRHLANTVERLCARRLCVGGSAVHQGPVAMRPVPKLLWAIVFLWCRLGLARSRHFTESSCIYIYIYIYSHAPVI